MANSKVRQLLTADPGAMAKVLQKHGVKSISGPYVSVTHKGFSVMEAPSVDAVYKVAQESGLAQWNSVDIIPVETPEQALKGMAGIKPLY